MNTLTRAATTAATLLLLLSVEAPPAAAQDAADAQKFSAKIFTIDIPGYTPAQAVDFAHAFIPFAFDNPKARWRPTETRERSETKVRLTSTSRGGGWLPTGNSIEYNFFAEPIESGARLSHYFVAVQNTGSAAEQRYDISHAAGLYRVSKGLHESAEKYMPQIADAMARVRTGGLWRFDNPSREIYISPAREAFVDDAERAYVGGDVAKAVAILRDPAVSDNPAALRRLSYLAARGEGMPADAQGSNEMLLHAAQKGDVVSAANCEFFGIGTAPNPRLGYVMMWLLGRSGNTDAIFSIAALHERGWPIPDQPEKYIGEAYRLYYIAGELGHVVAKSKAAQLAPKISDEIRSRAASDAEAWKKLATPRKPS